MDLNKMMREAQKMQQEIENIKQEIDQTIFTKTQANVVTIEMYGSKIVKDIKIASEVLDDHEMLQDLIMIAFNNCVQEIDEYTSEKMGAFKGIGGLI